MLPQEFCTAHEKGDAQTQQRYVRYCGAVTGCTTTEVKAAARCQ